MPRLRINLRTMDELDELIDEVDDQQEREEREERGREQTDKRVINPVALQRRQDSRKWGKEITRFQRQNKRLKP